MITKRETVAIATAFELMTCPAADKEPNALDVIRAWEQGQHYEGVIIWKPYQYMEPQELFTTLQTLTQTLLWFADNGDKLL